MVWILWIWCYKWSSDLIFSGNHKNYGAYCICGVEVHGFMEWFFLNTRSEFDVPLVLGAYERESINKYGK